MKRKDFFFVSLLLLTLLVVFFDLFTLQKSFLGGDHREQQYPWAKFYQSQIRQFHLPWWTRQIHCGFPLLAEGQIGAFYPLNFLFLFFLSIKGAYNYEILFQYFLGALFFFLYLRRHGISGWGAFFASLIYLFGSSQGGYFYYNLISQKVVIWLPLTLLWIDRLRKKENFADAFGLALTFSLQIFGGYLQVAIYSIFYSCLYFVYQWLKSRSVKFFSLFVVSGALAIFFSLVQLLPTFELSLFSSRAHAAEGLAFLGSMNPMGWLTLFYPSWDSFLGSEFYVGVLGLFFVLVSAFSKKESNEKFFLLSAGIFLVLALGKFSPLYVLLIKATHFYGFRTPIKFLFFVSFSCAILAGYGFDKFFFRRAKTKNPEPLFQRAYGVFLCSATMAAFVPSLAQWILSAFQSPLLSLLQDYTSKHIFAQAGHPYALDYYFRKAVTFYEGLLNIITLANRDTLVAWILLLFSIVFVTWMIQAGPRTARIRWICCLILFGDLFLYGFTSVKGNYEPFDSIDSVKQRSRIVDYLALDRGVFRVMEVYAEPTENRKFPTFPNFNMLYSFEDIGAYSPLVMKDYKDFLLGWGYTNDSISSDLVKPSKVLERLKTLSWLNVKYLLSTHKLHHEDLQPVMSEEGVILYRNNGVKERAFFLPHRSGLDSLDEIRNAVSADVRYENETEAKVEYEAPREGLLVLTDIAYPGWTVEVNGEEVPLLKVARLFRGVELKPGRNQIVFQYRPVFFRQFGLAAFVLASLIAFALGVRPFSGSVAQLFGRVPK